MSSFEFTPEINLLLHQLKEARLRYHEAVGQPQKLVDLRRLQSEIKALEKKLESLGYDRSEAEDRIY